MSTGSMDTIAARQGTVALPSALRRLFNGRRQYLCVYASLGGDTPTTP